MTYTWSILKMKSMDVNIELSSSKVKHISEDLHLTYHMYDFINVEKRNFENVVKMGKSKNDQNEKVEQKS